MLTARAVPMASQTTRWMVSRVRVRACVVGKASIEALRAIQGVGEIGRVSGTGGRDEAEGLK